MREVSRLAHGSAQPHHRGCADRGRGESRLRPGATQPGFAALSRTPVLPSAEDERTDAMTQRVNGVVVIEGEPDRRCQLCDKVEECRPAGPNGEQVCWDCANKDKAAMERYSQRLFQGGL